MTIYKKIYILPFIPIREHDCNIQFLVTHFMVDKTHESGSPYVKAKGGGLLSKNLLLEARRVEFPV